MPSPDRLAIPAIISLALRPLPLKPLELLLAGLTARLAARNPDMFARLGEHAEAVFAIVPTDMPFAFLLHPGAPDTRLNVVRRIAGTSHDAVISGPLMSLVALAEGRADGDALFFSRDLTVEGDVGAVLALRNAIDDARLDIAAELATPLGPMARPVRDLLRAAARQFTPDTVQSEAAAAWN